MTRTFPGMFTGTDYAEIIENLRELGYVEQDIEQVVEGLEAEHYSLSDVADLVYAAEIGDDDEWFMCACNIGLA